MSEAEHPGRVPGGAKRATAAEGARVGAEGGSWASEDRFALLVSRVKDYAIFMLNSDGLVATWNEGAERIKGYTAAEIIGKALDVFYTPEDQKRGHPKALLKKAETEGRVEEEGWRVRKDGTRFWADVVITALRDDDGNLRGFGKVTRDLTERREAEAALSELSGRLMQTQDEERRRLARELHDSTSPLLTGLLAKLYAVKQRLASGRDDPVTKLLDDALTNVEAMSTVVRTVSSMLHPPLLDESGILASVKWYLDAQVRRSDIKIEIHLPRTIPRLEKDTEIALFRVVQESVANILPKTGARRIRITITVAAEMDLTIDGDGPPIPPTALHEMSIGRGEIGVAVAGMRERMRQLGGKLTFSSERGLTALHVTMPLARQAKG